MLAVVATSVKVLPSAPPRSLAEPALAAYEVATKEWASAPQPAGALSTRLFTPCLSNHSISDPIFAESSPTITYLQMLVLIIYLV